MRHKRGMLPSLVSLHSKICNEHHCAAPASNMQLRCIQNRYMVTQVVSKQRWLRPLVIVTHDSHFTQTCRAIHTGTAQGSEQCHPAKMLMYSLWGVSGLPVHTQASLRGDAPSAKIATAVQARLKAIMQHKDLPGRL